MFEDLFQPMHLLSHFCSCASYFGPKNLPAIGEGLGETIRGFKKALNENEPNSPTSPEVVRKEDERRKEK